MQGSIVWYLVCTYLYIRYGQKNRGHAGCRPRPPFNHCSSNSHFNARVQDESMSNAQIIISSHTPSGISSRPLQRTWTGSLSLSPKSMRHSYYSCAGKTSSYSTMSINTQQRLLLWSPWNDACDPNQHKRRKPHSSILLLRAHSRSLQPSTPPSQFRPPLPNSTPLKMMRPNVSFAPRFLTSFLLACFFNGNMPCEMA